MGKIDNVISVVLHLSSSQPKWRLFYVKKKSEWLEFGCSPNLCLCISDVILYEEGKETAWGEWHEYKIALPLFKGFGWVVKGTQCLGWWLAAKINYGLLKTEKCRSKKSAFLLFIFLKETV